MDRNPLVSQGHILAQGKLGGLTGFARRPNSRGESIFFERVHLPPLFLICTFALSTGSLSREGNLPVGR
jgi:hypothetical protein